jgi:hypothetical protein
MVVVGRDIPSLNNVVELKVAEEFIVRVLLLLVPNVIIPESTVKLLCKIVFPDTVNVEFMVCGFAQIFVSVNNA